MMQHLQTEVLIDYMHGGLSPQDDAAVLAHLETCPECRREFEAEAALTEMLRSYAAQDQREMPAMLKAHVWERIRSDQPSRWSALRAWLRPALAVPAAVVIAAAAYFGTAYLGPHGAPSIEAAYYLQDHAALNSTVPFSDRSAVAPVDLDSASTADAAEQSSVAVQAASYTADANTP